MIIIDKSNCVLKNLNISNWKKLETVFVVFDTPYSQTCGS